MNQKMQLGKFGEDLAVKYLVKKGYKIIARNYHTQEGEIDIICQKAKTIFFVEVKTRSNKNFGYPEEAIDKTKLEKIIAACQKYINENNLTSNWQIDAISIIINKYTKTMEIKHIVALDIN